MTSPGKPRVLVCDDDAPLAGLALQSGFAMAPELSGTTSSPAQ